MIPVGVIELNEADAPLHQPAGEQTVVGERSLAWLSAIHGQRLLALAGNVDQLGCARLHSISNLVSRDARGNLTVAGLLQSGSVEIPDRVECLALMGGRDTLGSREVQD